MNLHVTPPGAVSIAIPHSAPDDRASMRAMRNRFTGALVALTLSVPLSVAVLSGPADAAGTGTYFSSCKRLNAKYPHGVAKSRAAAQKQVRAGYLSPKYGSYAQKVYWRNYKRLDRDRDGTACER
ncbi:excalibur calcium-binding domain-containing protein [Marmoricola sp. RAF53]|uniref:excalibur calcium-binding domain-containing protein n=1 Tax=Marmoricola sp. RAF53 TaxID=3233059 RepID=UPI003F98994D